MAKSQSTAAVKLHSPVRLVEENKKEVISVAEFWLTLSSPLSWLLYPTIGKTETDVAVEFTFSPAFGHTAVQPHLTFGSVVRLQSSDSAALGLFLRHSWSSWSSWWSDNYVHYAEYDPEQAHSFHWRIQNPSTAIGQGVCFGNQIVCNIRSRAYVLTVQQPEIDSIYSGSLDVYLRSTHLPGAIFTSVVVSDLQLASEMEDGAKEGEAVLITHTPVLSSTNTKAEEKIATLGKNVYINLSGSLDAPHSTPGPEVEDKNSAFKVTSGSQSIQNKMNEMRRKVREEITSSERSYVKSLGILVDSFLQPLKSKAEAYDMDLKQVQSIFSNVEQLAHFHRIFLKDIEEKDCFSKVICKLADFLKMYTQYLNEYSTSLQVINSNRNNKKFQSFLEERRKECGQDLLSYLIMPVQRIPRYELLLRELLRFTPENHSEFGPLQDAFKKIQTIAAHINEQKRTVENMSQLLRIQNRISGDVGVEMIQPFRRFIRETMLYRLSKGILSTGTKQSRIFLFTDLMVYTSAAYAYRGKFFLSSASVKEYKQLTKFGFEITSEAGKSKTFLCANESEAQEWLRSLRAQISHLSHASAKCRE